MAHGVVSPRYCCRHFIWLPQAIVKGYMSPTAPLQRSTCHPRLVLSDSIYTHSIIPSPALSHSVHTSHCCWCTIYHAFTLYPMWWAIRHHLCTITVTVCSLQTASRDFLVPSDIPRASRPTYLTFTFRIWHFTFHCCSPRNNCFKYLGPYDDDDDDEMLWEAVIKNSQFDLFRCSRHWLTVYCRVN